MDNYLIQMVLLELLFVNLFYNSPVTSRISVLLFKTTRRSVLEALAFLINTHAAEWTNEPNRNWAVRGCRGGLWVVTTGDWTRLREVALFSPSGPFLIQFFSLFIPLLSQTHLILLKPRRSFFFWWGGMGGCGGTPVPVTEVLFQSHIITHQCCATHRF